MSQENQERWLQLYEQAATEKNPQKLTELVYEIHCLLREKENPGPSANKNRNAA